MLAVILAAVLGQAGVPAPAGTEDLVRIRRRLAARPSVIEASDAPGEPGERPVFRVSIKAPRSTPRPWESDSIVPGSVRPFAPTYHHEFQSQVTHEFFRSSVLHPTGVPVVPLLKLLGILGPPSEASVRRREEKARAKIRAELDAFLRGRDSK